MQGRTLTRALSMAAIVAAAPLTIQSGRVVANRACGQFMTVTGTCCKEPMSICSAGNGDYVDYYYKTEGSCR